MKQPIRKRIAEANNVKQGKDTYIAVFDMNNIMKISSVDHRINSDGNEYGIVMSSLRIIGDILKKKDFDYCYAAYDGEGSGLLRWRMYPDYKANRDKHYEQYNAQSDYDKFLVEYQKRTIAYSRSKNKGLKRGENDEEAFARQKEILQSILEELCIRQFEFDSVEGDDIISYIVKNKHEHEKVVIVSSDKDLTQLISDTVIVYNPRIKDFITKDNSIEKLGITHENIVLQKILCGDDSDNIKGIKGMGETTLSKLFPEIITRKCDLETIRERSMELLEQRKAEKKKPLKSLENVLNGITDGCQGDKIYEINKAIIDLSEPLLTDEAKSELCDGLYTPMDTDDRDIKNVYGIISENNMSDLMNENKFGSIFGSYSRIIMMEKNRFKNFKEKKQ